MRVEPVGPKVLIMGLECEIAAIELLKAMYAKSHNCDYPYMVGLTSRCSVLLN